MIIDGIPVTGPATCFASFTQISSQAASCSSDSSDAYGATHHRFAVGTQSELSENLEPSCHDSLGWPLIPPWYGWIWIWTIWMYPLVIQHTYGKIHHFWWENSRTFNGHFQVCELLVITRGYLYRWPSSACDLGWFCYSATWCDRSAWSRFDPSIHPIKYVLGVKRWNSLSMGYFHTTRPIEQCSNPLLIDDYRWLY